MLSPSAVSTEHGGGLHLDEEIRLAERGVENDPTDIALRFWASGHGIVSLTVTGVLPVADLQRHAPAVACALFIDAGDSPDRARRAVRSAWRGTDAMRLA